MTRRPYQKRWLAHWPFVDYFDSQILSLEKKTDYSISTHMSWLVNIETFFRCCTLFPCPIWIELFPLTFIDEKRKNQTEKENAKIFGRSNSNVKVVGTFSPADECGRSISFELADFVVVVSCCFFFILANDRIRPFSVLLLDGTRKRSKPYVDNWTTMTLIFNQIRSYQNSTCFYVALPNSRVRILII